MIKSECGGERFAAMAAAVTLARPCVQTSRVQGRNRRQCCVPGLRKYSNIG